MSVPCCCTRRWLGIASLPSWSVICLWIFRDIAWSPGSFIRSVHPSGGDMLLRCSSSSLPVDGGLSWSGQWTGVLNHWLLSRGFQTVSTCGHVRVWWFPWRRFLWWSGWLLHIWWIGWRLPWLHRILAILAVQWWSRRWYVPQGCSGMAFGCRGAWISPFLVFTCWQG